MSQKNLIQAFLLLVFHFAFISLSAQTTYRLGNSPATNNATINTCTGTFVDSGNTGNYGDGENTTVTFCSNSDAPISFAFTSFSLGAGDTLKIYDGASISSPLLGTFIGSLTPDTITASNSCLTFRFISNTDMVVGSGWSANISCYVCTPPPCDPNDYVDLNFNSDSVVVVSNPSGFVGDKWRFKTVTAGYDALVEVIGAVGATGIRTIDLPNNPSGRAFSWAPEIVLDYNGNTYGTFPNDRYADWRITFVATGTNTITPLPKAARVTSYDIDGPASDTNFPNDPSNNFKELQGHVSPNGYAVSNNTQLIIKENSPAPYTVAIGGPDYAGITDDDRVKANFYYANQLESFDIRLGIRRFANTPTFSGDTARQFAVSFEACPFETTIVTNPLVPTISGDFDLCISENLTQTYNLANLYNSVNWEVIGGTIVSSSNLAITITWGGTGVHIIRFTTTDGVGCVIRNSHTILVRPQPTAIATGATVCVGQTINLTASGGTSYAWTGPGGYTSSVQNPSRTNATTGMAGTYTVTVTDANGCTNTANATVVVNTTPTITLTATQAQACRGATNTTLTYSATGGSPTTFSIDFASGITDIVNAPFSGGILNIPISGSLAVGTYSGTLTVNNPSCSSSGIPITVQIFAPVIVNAGTDKTICSISGSPGSVTLTGSSISGGVNNGSWSIISGGGNLSSTAITTSPQNIIYTAANNYSGDVVLRLTSTTPSTPCPAVFDEVTISVNFVTGGTITGTQTICIDGDPAVIGN
ncbi:MAG TPA: hypothetical protein PKD18_03805 [Saprospiraceae bacterium]|nr:hypothetical protein [Saprospiraceae bacterium]